MSLQSPPCSTVFVRDRTRIGFRRCLPQSEKDFVMLRGRFNTLTSGESPTPAASVDQRTPPTRSCRLPQQVLGITGRVLDNGGGHTR
jgi:hypothetical protein